MLLIVRVLKGHTAAFAEAARQRGLEALVELHDLTEVPYAQEARARMVGINARDLSTFTLGEPTAAPLRKAFLLRYANGLSNEEAARLSGIPVWRTRLIVFALSGLLAAFCGIIISSRIMSGAYNVGEGLEFDVIAAVVIGGTPITGGRGSLAGAILGALVISVLQNGLSMLGLPSEKITAIVGVTLMVGVMRMPLVETMAVKPSRVA